ncbi:MAG: Gfo/Idh/MocA family oxidoreductase [Saprospiraceae bacterium]|nr:Gfo/Idh/MocA family oxidoreductase [Saprospiraceae bacterium]
MIGGGKGSFIGAVHRMAAALDGQTELVCGAFSSNPEVSYESGKELYLPDSRIYSTYQEMIYKENLLPEEVRMELISVVTPNHVHFEPVKMGLEAGFHVICDKPLCFNLEEAYILFDIVKNSDKIFALTHNYTGYPMVKQAKYLVDSGKMGKIRKVVTEYAQGWLSNSIENEGQKQASWRTDPNRSGIAGAIGDIGTHAENLGRYISGLEMESICADINTHVEGRALDDDGNILVRYSNGASGILYASQISAGEENNLKIRIYGETGSLEWSQMEPNTLIVKWLDKPTQYFRTGSHDLCQHAVLHSRLPSGHPEGYIEAFANIYRNVSYAIQNHNTGHKNDQSLFDFPGIEDGVKGMEFIYKAIQSGQENKKWLNFKN